MPVYVAFFIIVTKALGGKEFRKESVIFAHGFRDFNPSWWGGKVMCPGGPPVPVSLHCPVVTSVQDVAMAGSLPRCWGVSNLESSCLPSKHFTNGSLSPTSK